MIAARLREDLNIKPDAEVKNLALQVSLGLIKNGVYPGFLAQAGGFDFWPSDTEELVARIAASWPAVGIPTLAYDACWFAKRSD